MKLRAIDIRNFLKNIHIFATERREIHSVFYTVIL